MITVLLAVVALIEAGGILLLLRRQPECAEPENNHPGRVLPKGVPIGHALKAAPEPPNFHVPYGKRDSSAPLTLEEQRRLLRRVLCRHPVAEQALLGALIFDRSQIPRVLSIVPEPGMFSAARHILIYQAILWLHREGIPVDLVSLRDELASNGLLKLVGGPEYLTELVESVPNAANAPEYARSIFDLFFERLT